jgi:hypothetical protein
VLFLFNQVFEAGTEIGEKFLVGFGEIENKKKLF